MSTKPLASELFGKLKPVLGEDEARTICKGKIDSGDLTDDLGVAPVITAKALDSFLDNLQKAFTPDPAAATATLTSSRLAKGGKGKADDDVSIEGLLDVVESQFGSLSADTNRHYNQLVKGLTAIGDLQKANIVALAEMDRRNTDLTAAVTRLEKTVESIAKGAPKAVSTTTAVVPHPAEASGTKQAAADGTENVNVNAELTLYKAAVAEIHTQLTKGDVPEDRKMELRLALGELESGAMPSRINTSYSLGLS